MHLLIQLGRSDVTIDLNNPLCSTDCLISSSGSSALTPSQLILSGGEGYINFRIGELRRCKSGLATLIHSAQFVTYWSSTKNLQAMTRMMDRPMYPKVPLSALNEVTWSSGRTRPPPCPAVPSEPSSDEVKVEQKWDLHQQILGQHRGLEETKWKVYLSHSMKLFWLDHAVNWKCLSVYILDFYVIQLIFTVCLMLL